MQLELNSTVIAALRRELGHVAAATVRTIRQEVPDYAGPLSGAMGANIESAVQMALAGFLRLTDQGFALGGGVDPSVPLSPALEGAYALGRGEARSGRSADALLSAYRIGARVSWRELSAVAVRHGVSADELAAFAELVFAYIDALSGATVSGHQDEVATTGRVRERRLDRLTRALLAGADPEELEVAAERADWKPPTTLTAVVLPESRIGGLSSRLPNGTLRLTGDLPDLSQAVSLTVLLVPDVAGPQRRTLLAGLVQREAVVGPVRPWTQVRSSYDRAIRARDTEIGGSDPVDTEEHLAALVVTADADALQDLRARVLAPFDELREAVADKLIETLRSWLLHQGRRDAVAKDLFVHPQTVRYRMTQLRELYGDQLDNPQMVRDLVVALCHAPLGPTDPAPSVRP